MTLLKKTFAAVLALTLLLLLAAPAWAVETEHVLILPEDLTHIEGQAFSCTDTAAVRFPDGIEVIADNAFGTAIQE